MIKNAGEKGGAQILSFFVYWVFETNIMKPPGILSHLSPIRATISTNWEGFRSPYLLEKSSSPNETILGKQSNTNLISVTQEHGNISTTEKQNKSSYLRQK